MTYGGPERLGVWGPTDVNRGPARFGPGGRWSAKGSAVANVTAAVRGSGPFLLVLLSSSL